MADGRLAQLVDAEAEEILADMGIEPTLDDLTMAKALALSRITGDITPFREAFRTLIRKKSVGNPYGC